MAHLLAELTKSSEPEFSRGIHSLESLTGRTGIDVALIADIARRVRIKTSELGLDPTDTTVEELYAALQARIELCDAKLATHLNATASDDVDSIVDGVIAHVDSQRNRHEVWVVKHAVMKKMLRALAPKKTLKALGYKSIDSMIKREPVEAVLCVARLLETKAWQERLAKHLAKLSPSDFETRAIAIIRGSTRWQQQAHLFVVQHGHNLLFSKELGAVVVLSLPVDKLPGLATVLTALILHAIVEQRTYSAYFKLHQVKADFGKVFANAVSPNSMLEIDMSGRRFSWRTVLQHMGSHTDGSSVRSILEPHIQPEDVAWDSVEAELGALVPEFVFWQDTTFVAVKDHNDILSFNLIDNAISYCNRLSCNEQLQDYGRQGIIHELMLRYIADSMLEPQLIQTLQQGLLRIEGES